ncbi:MAG: BamA/TamA family outer membrane protein [Acidobacteriia bacterium]|nr:BamA/TamA family outer membrane protein [Terriglobia bacterium]
MQAEILESPEAYEGKTVQEVRYMPPTQPITRADLTRIMPLHSGMPLHLAEVRAAIKKLYSTGLYADIALETEPAAGGVIVTIRTTEQWFVGPVEVHGKVTYPPNEGQLTNAARLQLGTPFEDTDVDNAVKGLRSLLQRNGLYLATVQPQIERDSEHQEVAVTFAVRSGKRAKLTLPVVVGDTRLPADQLAKAAGFKHWFRWKTATEQNTQSGLQKIQQKYQKKDRLTADVSLENQEYLASDNRVRTTINADGGPKVKIDSKGAKISKKVLQRYVPVSQEETVNRDLLVQGVANLRDYFQGSGYFDVQVDFQTTQPDADQENITYIIGLGERHKLVRVDIQGNRYFRASDIRERIFLQPAGFIRLRHGRYSQGFADRDKDAISALYQDNGFQDVKVTANIMNDYKGKTGDVAVTFVIDEGPQYKVGTVQVDGVDRPDRSRVLAKLACVPGEPFSKINVSLDRDYFLNVYQSEGYPDVNFDWRMTAQPDTREVNLVYTVMPGAPRFIRDVLLTGLRTTRRRLVDPNIILKEGEPLSWTRMGEMQRRLYNLGVFDKVDMAIQNPQGDTENKYVLYHLTEGHRYYTAVGFGAELAQIGGSPSSLSAPGGQTGFSPEGSFEISRLNMWGLGHTVDFKSSYSSLDRRVSLSYLAPRYHNVDGRNITVTALYDNERDVRTFTARRIEGDLQLSQKLSKATTVLWRYTWRNVQVDQTTLKIEPLLIPLYSQPSRIGMLSANLIQDRRDDPVNAHRGFYNTADLGVAESYFGGNKDFLRFLGRTSYYHPITGEWVFAVNTQFGWLHPFSVPANETAANYIPLPERFFGGGSNSMRGFPDNQAGPRDPTTGFPLGGNALLFSQAEIRFPLIGDNINGVIFHDMGNIYSDLGSISFRYHQKSITDFNYMVHAIGFGIRYRTPVGPVRVDLAYSLNTPTFYGLKGTYDQLLNGTATSTVQGISHFQFFFSIGQAF